MNEQIDKLLVNAGAYFGAECVVYDNFDPKKFAELIVRECMQVVHNGINNATDWDSSSWDQCCENRMYAIQRHFGVEE